MIRSLEDRRVRRHIMQQIMTEEQRLEALEQRMARHNPVGHGFDSAFGHKGGTSGGIDGFRRPQVMTFIGGMQSIFEADDQLCFQQEAGNPDRLLIHRENELVGASAFDLRRSTGNNGSVWSQNDEFRFLAGDTDPGSFVTTLQGGSHYHMSVQEDPGSTTGRFINAFGYIFQNNGWNSADLGDLASGWSNISLSGSNPPSVSSGSSFNIGQSLNGSKLLNWQTSNFRIGVWNTATTTTWDASSFTPLISLSNIEAQSHDSMLGIDAVNNEALMNRNENSVQFGRRNFELVDVSGTVATQIATYLDVETPNIDRIRGLLMIDDVWCLVGSLDATDGGGFWILSIDFIND